MKEAPHKAIVRIKVEMMEVLRSGEVSGLPVKSGLPTHSFLFTGSNFEECKEKVKSFLEGIQCQS